MQEQSTPIVVEQGPEPTILTCNYGAASLMRIYDDGDVASLILKGETMDAIVKAWQEYRASQKAED